MKSTAAAMIGAVSLLLSGQASASTWFVYCEGRENGQPLVVLSANQWAHPGPPGYGERVADGAETYFRRRGQMRLSGCSAVPFGDAALADQSYERTVRLHQSMGSRVIRMPFPNATVAD